MSFARLRPVVTQAVRLATPIRTFTSSRPVFVSGYGKNSAQKGGQQPVDPQASGEIPVYSGPSITEKRQGSSVQIEEEFGSELKSKRDADFADNMFEEPKGLSNDGGEWNGKIREPRSDLQNAKASKGKVAGDSSAGKLKKKGTKLTGDSMDIGQPKRHESTWRDNDPAREDWKDDTQRLKEKAQNQLHKAKLSAEETAVDLKEGAQSIWHKTKKAARSAKESIKESVDSLASPTTGPVTRSDLSGAPTSTSGKGQPGHRLFNADDEESTAMKSGEVIGEEVDSLRKGFFDGPQDMPQGVGRRAVDETGTPLETGTRGS